MLLGAGVAGSPTIGNNWLKDQPKWGGNQQGWKNETHPDKNGKTEGIRTTKADEDKPLNKPMRDDGDKKFKVYVKDPKTGNYVSLTTAPLLDTEL